MSALTAASVALGVLVAIICLAVLAVLVRSSMSRNGEVRVYETDNEGHLAIRTPYGVGTARLVVHLDRGRVYEIALNLRGESGPTLTYTPPATALVRTHVVQRVDTLRMKR